MKSQPRFLRRAEVMEITGLSRPSLYRLMGMNCFPKGVKIGVRAVAWRESDIAAWMDSRPEQCITEHRGQP